MDGKKLHIVSFDVPWPADYGGVIDVFHKLRHLHAQGLEIILHCFQYGRSESELLKKFAKAVYYYPRFTGKGKLLHAQPYIVLSRKHPELTKNLSGDGAPILFEGLHSTSCLRHPDFRNRKKIIRAHNIEHAYYRQLARSEHNYFKKAYLLSEALKLEKYESVCREADLVAGISASDTLHFRELCDRAFLLPPFHGYDEVLAQEGRGNYFLYHGNLGVSENEAAALWLTEEVAPQLNAELLIAGHKPGPGLRKMILKQSHVRLIESPSEDLLNQLIREAQAHLMPAFQASGVKLKLLHALFNGRHVLANRNMLAGTGLEDLCIRAESAGDFISAANGILKTGFEKADIHKREEVLGLKYSNRTNARRLIDQIWP
ncbi:MAG: hypothetical protein JNL88_11340 [Bacteroidia bacterium]|nr:hypothetical protein [Bacteroidia bacterium]